MTCYAEPPGRQAAATEAICALIGEILGIHDVTGDEDFFELGGTSLQGATVIAQIERRLGRRLSLADLYENPTAARLAERLDTDATPPGAAVAVSTVWLTPPQPGLATAPVVLVHQLHAGLARELGRRRPVLGLSYGVSACDGNAWPPPTGVEALATHYVAELRAVYPTGPYHLAGHCARGAAVTWEVARQLQDAGAEVQVVCLIDGARASHRVSWSAALHKAGSMPRRLLALIVLRSVLYRLSRALERFQAALSDTQSTCERLAQLDQPTRLKLIDLQLDAYSPRPLTSRPVFIEAVKPRRSIRTEPVPLAHHSDGQDLCPDGLVVIHIPGDHRSLFRAPLVQRTAAAVEAAIQAHER